MGDNPYKLGPSALEELRSLSLDTRRHLHGLFERFTEGLIIVALEVVFLLFSIAASPSLIQGRSGLVKFIWLVFLFFSIAWPLRSIYEIRKEIIASLSPKEQQEGNTYSRYCEGAWFLRTLGGLIVAGIILAAVLW